MATTSAKHSTPRDTPPPTQSSSTLCVSTTSLQWKIMSHYYDESNLRACFAIKLNNRVSLELIGLQGILFFYLVTAWNIFLHRYTFANICA